MKVNYKEQYETPSLTVADFKTEGVICGSDILAGTEGGTEDYFRTDLQEW